jgi:drug/metabolite transporter (DMT)-like permease
VLWGGTFFLAEVALAEVRPLTLVLARVGLAAVALVVVVHATGLRMPSTVGPWAAFLVMGGLNNLVPFSLIFWAQTAITGSLAAILNATTPLFTVVLAHFLTRDEPMSGARLIGVVLGIAGVTVIIGPAALADLGTHAIAQLAVIVAALSYACAGIFGRRFRGQPPLVTAAGQLTATTALMLPLVLILDRPWQASAPGGAVWGAILGLALLCTALAYVIYFRILATAGATNLLLVTFLIPVSAIVLGTAFLGERLETQDLGGMALIGLGLAAIDGRPLRRLGARIGPATAPIAAASIEGDPANANRR